MIKSSKKAFQYTDNYREVNEYVINNQHHSPSKINEWIIEDQITDTYTESSDKISVCSNENLTRILNVSPEGLSYQSSESDEEIQPKLFPNKNIPIKKLKNSEINSKNESLVVKKLQNLSSKTVVKHSKQHLSVNSLQKNQPSNRIEKYQQLATQSVINRRIKPDALWLNLLTPVPFREAGVVWNGVYRRVPAFVFSPTVMMNRDSCVKILGEKLNLSCKLIKSDCRLLRTLLHSHGFSETHGSSSEFNLMWTNSHLKPFQLKCLLDFQKINHFPKSYELTRKDKLANNIKKMQYLKGVHNFDFVPVTFVIPDDLQELRNHYSKEHAVYIVKPIASSRGRGIYLITNPDGISIDDSVIVSRYISNPLLIDGFKFDLRLYVAVTSYEPLVVYVYEEGLARFATVRYQSGIRHIRNMCMHLTNYSVNKRNHDFVHNDDADVEDFGNKWSLGAIIRYLRSEGKDTAGLMMRIEDIIVKSLISVENPISMACRSFQPFKHNCFELYGFDIIVDDGLRPWLLEVNLSPSLACDTPLDFKVKSNMLSDLLSLTGIICHDPNRKYSSSVNYSSMNYTGIANFTAPKHPGYFIPAHHYAITEIPSTTHFPPRRSRSASSGSLVASENNAFCMTNIQSKVTAAPKDVTMEESRLVRRLQEEAARSGGWMRLLPNIEAWEQYSSLYQLGTLSQSNPFPPIWLNTATLNSNSCLSDKRVYTDNVHSSVSSPRISTPAPPNNLFSIHQTTAIAIGVMNWSNKRAIERSFQFNEKRASPIKYSPENFSTIVHPNILAPHVDLGMYTGLADAKPREESACDIPFLSIPSVAQVLSKAYPPLHSLPPNILAECLMVTLGYENCEFKVTHDQAKCITACYTLTLGRLPFYHRKLGSQPVVVRGVCLLANCDHSKAFGGKNCGIRITNETDLGQFSKKVVKSPSEPTLATQPNIECALSDPATPRAIKKSYLLCLSDIQSMSKLQARNAFSAYLSRIQARVSAQAREISVETPESEIAAEEQLELMVRFLQKAAINLSPQAVSTICSERGETLGGDMNSHGVFKIPSFNVTLSLTEKRQHLIHFLDRFIRVYMYETALDCNNADVKTNAGVELTRFRTFIRDATESELESALAQYTRIHRSVSLFIGNSKSNNNDYQPPFPISKTDDYAKLKQIAQNESSNITKLQYPHINRLITSCKNNLFVNINGSDRESCKIKNSNTNKCDNFKTRAVSQEKLIPKYACVTVTPCVTSNSCFNSDNREFVVMKRASRSRSQKAPTNRKVRPHKLIVNPVINENINLLECRPINSNANNALNSNQKEKCKLSSFRRSKVFNSAIPGHHLHTSIRKKQEKCRSLSRASCLSIKEDSSLKSSIPSYFTSTSGNSTKTSRSTKSLLFPNRKNDLMPKLKCSIDHYSIPVFSPKKYSLSVHGMIASNNGDVCNQPHCGCGSKICSSQNLNHIQSLSNVWKSKQKHHEKVLFPKVQQQAVKCKINTKAVCYCQSTNKTIPSSSKRLLLREKNNHQKL